LSVLAEALQRANSDKMPRRPGQWTGEACKAFRQSGPEAARLLEAALAWELTAERLATPGDEPAIRQRLAKMEETTAAARAKAEKA